jgi:hypothetical protein
VAFHKKAGPAHHGHGQEELGLSRAAQLPSRHRMRDFVSEARISPGALRLARVDHFTACVCSSVVAYHLIFAGSG